MTDAELRAARLEMRRTGEPTRAVLDELAGSVRSVLLRGRLPPALSPEGHWEGDVPDELRQRWIADKLLAQGPAGSELRALLEKARSARAFSSMARRSFYHWLLSNRERSQATNIYKRLLDVLEENPDVFRVAQEATQRQHRFWQLAEGSDLEPFAGSDRELAAAAFAAGEIRIVRYGVAAKRRSPLISSGDLLRVARILIQTLGRAVTPAQIMRALGARLDLDDAQPASLAETHQAQAAAAPDWPGLREAAVAAIAQMTRRGPEVLLRLDRGEAAQDIAQRLGVSPATISAERAAAHALLRELSDDDDEMGALLKCVLDLLYEAVDE